MKVRVLVVDDHPHAREAIGEILAEDDGFEVIGYAENGERAVELTELWMPDLILMDIQMPGKDGLETTREIKLRYPYVKIVLITVSDDAAHLFEALKQGAQGYLLKIWSQGHGWNIYGPSPATKPRCPASSRSAFCRSFRSRKKMRPANRRLLPGSAKFSAGWRKA
ncbi:hypothetical protein HMSSN036_57280 [Paenibacillus macerans]|nr:hypothetical protein HMSSN036_57280 [Paenibacillus macerans]